MNSSQVISCAHSHSYHASRLSAACTAIVCLLAAIAPAHAQNKFWTVGAGGAFESAANWSTTSGGPGGAAPPGAAETANFTLGGAPYTVTINANVTNAGLNVTNGNVTFDVNGFTYLISGAAGTLIGSVANQTGRLTVRDGTLGVDSAGDDIVLGTVATSAGFLTITSAGRLGTGASDADLFVGNSGTGTLTIEQSGRADVAVLNIAQNNGSTGTILVNGADALLDASGPVTVGLAGTGSLGLQDGGKMTSAGAAFVASAVGSRGTVGLTGANTSWTQAGAFTLGVSGEGNLNIQSAAKMSTGGPVIIGNQAVGTGVAVVTGTDSTWTITSTLNVGGMGEGNLAATGGGQISTTGLSSIGHNTTGKGLMVVTGAGSRWTTGAVNVGTAGNGTLGVSAGGVVNSTGAAIIANQTGSVGEATVTGLGSAWNITGPLTVANLGTGKLTVENGGSLTVNGAMSIVEPAGAATGTLIFNGGTINANSFVRNASSVLNWTDGTLQVNGGAFNNGGANLILNGGDSDDAPALRLASGATSVVANLPNLTIGSSRRGTVVVSGGSSFQTTTTSIGTVDGSNGTLFVEGLNSVLSTTGDLAVGGTAIGAGGVGTVNIGIGGTVSAGGTLRLWNSAIINVSGGTLAFNGIAPSGGRINLNAGAVRALSNLNANAAVLDAILGPAHSLGLGRRIEVPGSSLILTSDLTVDGGIVTGGGLSMGPSVVATVRGGGSVTMTNGIVNPASARIFVTDGQVSAGAGAFTNAGELLLSGSTATVNAGFMTNTGLVSGTGRLNFAVVNDAAGQIRVAPGERLEILGSSGTNQNNGLIDVDGGAIEFGRSITNSTVSPSTGLIAARNATLRFFGGLNNSGVMTFTNGISEVFGDINVQNNLATPGRIIVTGGAQANFFDDIVNSGDIRVSAAGTLASTGVFLGSLSGNGVSGTGNVFIEGDARPGFSPGTMAFGGDLTFGSLSTLEIELAGTTPGTQYDRVTVADMATLDGTLEVSLLGGFMPALGNSFQILSATGGITGTFASTVLPALAGGMAWDVNYAPQSVTLAVGGVLGDYNLDGIVDTADFVVWRNSVGSGALVADGSLDGVVDQADLNVWRANFGKTAPAGAGAGVHLPAAVPEPSAAFLFGLAVALVALQRRANRR